MCVQGGASNAELLISLLLAATLVYIPITIAVIGKKLWFTFRCACRQACALPLVWLSAAGPKLTLRTCRFTNKRLTIINKSPLFAKTVRSSRVGVVALWPAGWLHKTLTNATTLRPAVRVARAQIEVAYSNIAEIRTAPRAFGLWGDAVVFLKDGSRLELTGLERYADIKRHIESCIYDDA